jgi:hypothetical protein
MRFVVIFITFFLMFFNAFAERDAGLILNGIDTVSTQYGVGFFDFITANPCSTLGGATSSCVGHVGLQYSFNDFGYSFFITRSGGLAKDTGKINLDSIKYAPPDSLMFADLGIGASRIFLIRPDSLKQCIGNCYVLKTGVDPRLGGQFYAKFKILGFDVTDSANHIVKMRFLWTYNDNGFKDLRTSGLDTFHLDTTPTLSRHTQLATNRISRTNGGQYVFKVVGDRFVLPPGLEGKSVVLSVYDLSGRKLGQISVKNEKAENLRQFMKNRGVAVERTSPWETEYPHPAASRHPSPPGEG